MKIDISLDQGFYITQAITTEVLAHSFPNCNLYISGEKETLHVQCVWQL